MDQLNVVWSSAQCGFTDWQDIWGDPWLSGSILVIAYLLTGITVLSMSRMLLARERLLWALCGCALLFQAANTPLDLHAFVWTFGKCLAKAQGWYALRDQVQGAVLIGLICSAGLIIAGCGFLFRRNISNNLLLIVGLLLSISVPAVKGIDLETLAGILAQKFGPLFVGDWLELAGLLLVWLAIKSHRRKKSQNPKAR